MISNVIYTYWEARTLSTWIFQPLNHVIFNKPLLNWARAVCLWVLCYLQSFKAIQLNINTRIPGFLVDNLALMWQSFWKLLILMGTYHFDTFCLTGFTDVYFVEWSVFRVSIFSCRPPYKLLHFKYIRLDSILSLSFALYGLIMIPPWLNTRSMGELLAGTDSTLIARGKSLGRLFLFTNQKYRQALGPFSLWSNSAATSKYLWYWDATDVFILLLLCLLLL